MKSLHNLPLPSLSASNPSATVHEMSVLPICKVHRGIPDLEQIHSFIGSLYLLGHNLTEMT